jgi:hypothetical protein
MYGEARGPYRIFVVKPEGRRPLGRPRSRWEDNIKMYLRKNLMGEMEWIDLALESGNVFTGQ